MDAPQSARFRVRRLGLWTAAVLLFVALFYYSRRDSAPPPAPDLPLVPVATGTAQTRDVPLYLEGLGTVQALNTVLIRSRVDGQLEKVFFREGQDVRAGEKLAQIDPRPFAATLAQAEAKQQQDAAQLANARLDLTRDTNMVTQNAVSRQIFDTQKALVAQLEAAVAADAAAVETARLQLDYASILSPLDGRTGIRLVDEGNMVHASDAGGLVVVTQLRPISVIFTLPEQELAALREQKRDAFEVDALGRENAVLLASGTLVVIDNLIDSTTGTIRLKANFPNAELRLWPGEFVNVRLLLKTQKAGLVVPATAVQRGPDGLYVFVVKSDAQVEVRPVKTGQTQGGETLITEGLQPDERVVTEGAYRLQAHSKVKLVQATGTNGK